MSISKAEHDRLITELTAIISARDEELLEVKKQLESASTNITHLQIENETIKASRRRLPFCSGICLTAPSSTTRAGCNMHIPPQAYPLPGRTVRRDGLRDRESSAGLLFPSVHRSTGSNAPEASDALRNRRRRTGLRP